MRSGTLPNPCTARVHPRRSGVQIARQSDLEYKKKLAKNLAGIMEDGAAKDIPVSPHQGTMFPEGEND